MTGQNYERHFSLWSRKGHTASIHETNQLVRISLQKLSLPRRHIVLIFRRVFFSNTDNNLLLEIKFQKIMFQASSVSQTNLDIPRKSKQIKQDSWDMKVEPRGSWVNRSCHWARVQIPPPLSNVEMFNGTQETKGLSFIS